jgi:hypothetical protein
MREICAKVWYTKFNAKSLPGIISEEGSFGGWYYRDESIGKFKLAKA